MTRKEKIKFLVLRSIGNFLVLFSLYGVSATFGPALYYEVKFRLSEWRGIHYTVALATPATTPSTTPGMPLSPTPVIQQLRHGEPTLGDILTGDKTQVMHPVDTNFGIIIPKIGANAKIYPNVDASNPNEFLPILMKGIAHAKGSVFPGFPGNTYLFAHSTDNWWDVGRYNAVFYLLKDLSPGDQVIVFFENRRYDYVVQRTVITDPSDTSLLVNSHGSKEQLVMQTCWPPGTTWKRLFVIAVPKGT